MAGERTEKATPKRRTEARKKGQVARSQEVNSTAVLLAAAGALAIAGPAMAANLRSLLTETMTRVAQPDITSQTIGGLMNHWAMAIGTLLAPVLAAAALAGVVANVIQNKPGFTPAAIRPDFKKVSPIGGIKRLAGPHALMEFGKSIFKVAIVAGVAALVLWPEIDQLASLGQMTPRAIGSYTAGLVIKLAFFILAVLVPLAIADLIFQRHQHEKQMKMSKQDVKEEHRQQDIAPEIKSAIRRRGMQMSRQRMLAQIPSADVIITNPTHFAIALRYGRDVSAPKVVAKGQDLIALRIREIAAEHDIAIVENPPLARALYKAVEVDQEIPAEFFTGVAEVLAYVYRTSRRKLSWA
jgi:flagellar biosynthetic protein FlhB